AFLQIAGLLLQSVFAASQATLLLAQLVALLFGLPFEGFSLLVEVVFRLYLCFLFYLLGLIAGALGDLFRLSTDASQTGPIEQTGAGIAQRHSTNQSREAADKELQQRTHSAHSF